MRWGTTKETVEIALKEKRRKSNWEKISENDVIAIREQYNETNLSSKELATKFKTTSDNIMSIVKYKTRFNVDTDKKSTYKINNLSGNQLNDFILTKNKINFITPNNLELILVEYVNTPATLNKLAKKYKVNLKQLKNNITSLPTINLLHGEEFKTISKEVRISNMGRVTVSGKISNQKRFKIGNKYQGIRIIVGTLFVPNPNKYIYLKSLDGNIHNIHYSNLKWCHPTSHSYMIDKKIMCLHKGKMIPLLDVKDIIINEYLEATENINFCEKYQLGKKTLYNILKPYLKKTTERKCLTCGETNDRYFYKKIFSLCKSCYSDANMEKFKGLSNEKRKRIQGKVREWARNNSVKLKLTQSRMRAKNKKMCFDLDEEYINELFKKQNGRCIYTNVPIKLTDDGVGELFSIDRMDSSKGYVKGNVVLTTGFVNKMKSNYKLSEFLNIIKLIYEHNFK